MSQSASKQKLLIGLDAGTTSIKALLLSESGKVLAVSACEYDLEFGGEESCELESQVYWAHTCRAIRSLLEQSGADPSDVAAFSVSSQGETLIALDDQGKPLRKAIVWLDNRPVNEARQIASAFVADRIFETTGQPEVLPMWPACRILWLRNHESVVFRQTSKYMMVGDFLLYKLTGQYATDYSLASDSLYFDIRRKAWWKEMLSYIGINENQLPPLFPPATPLGRLTSEAASDTGLTTGALGVTGAYDHPAGAVGAGSLEAGTLTLTIGASMAMCVPIYEPYPNRELNLPCQCHAIDGLYFLLPYAQTAGMVLKWFRDHFFSHEARESKTLGNDPYAEMSRLASEVPFGSGGLVMLPHLMGAGSPEFDPVCRGVFAGITPFMHKGHFIRAIMEAVACSIRRNLAEMQKRGIRVNEIRLLGGASRSHTWCQIIADLTGLPVVTLTQSENAALGAAMLAGKGAGVFPHLHEASRFIVSNDARYLPQADNLETGNEIYIRYVNLYASLQNYW